MRSLFPFRLVPHSQKRSGVLVLTGCKAGQLRLGFGWLGLVGWVWFLEFWVGVFSSLGLVGSFLQFVKQKNGCHGVKHPRMDALMHLVHGVFVGHGFEREENEDAGGCASGTGSWWFPVAIFGLVACPGSCSG